MPKQQSIPGTIPKAHYRCEGVDLGTEQVAQIHFRSEDGGFFPPEQLFFIRIIDRKGDMECTSFFCADCIEAYGLKTSKKATLKGVIEERISTAHQSVLRDPLLATGN